MFTEIERLIHIHSPDPLHSIAVSKIASERKRGQFDIDLIIYFSNTKRKLKFGWYKQLRNIYLGGFAHPQEILRDGANFLFLSNCYNPYNM